MIPTGWERVPASWERDPDGLGASSDEMGRWSRDVGSEIPPCRDAVPQATGSRARRAGSNGVASGRPEGCPRDRIPSRPGSRACDPAPDPIASGSCFACRGRSTLHRGSNRLHASRARPFRKKKITPRLESTRKERAATKAFVFAVSSTSGAGSAAKKATLRASDSLRCLRPGYNVPRIDATAFPPSHTSATWHRPVAATPPSSPRSRPSYEARPGNRPTGSSSSWA